MSLSKYLKTWLYIKNSCENLSFKSFNQETSCKSTFKKLPPCAFLIPAVFRRSGGPEEEKEEGENGPELSVARVRSRKTEKVSRPWPFRRYQHTWVLHRGGRWLVIQPHSLSDLCVSVCVCVYEWEGIIVSHWGVCLRACVLRVRGLALCIAADYKSTSLEAQTLISPAVLLLYIS